MNTCFTFWVIIQHYFMNPVAQTVLVLITVNTFTCPYVSFMYPHQCRLVCGLLLLFIFEYFLTFLDYKMLQDYFIYLIP